MLTAVDAVRPTKQRRSFPVMIVAPPAASMTGYARSELVVTEDIKIDLPLNRVGEKST